METANESEVLQPHADMTVPGIEVQGVRKQFRNIVALEHIDLNVMPREIIAILGPNGAGKSTLLRIISTIIVPDRGNVRIGGVDGLRSPRTARKMIGSSFGDDRAWYWRLTGRQNLEFFATLYGIAKQEDQRRIDQLLDEFHLADVADRPFGTYSSGMKARFSLMRALLPSPRVLLLDEPTRSLDPIAAADFRESVMSLRETEQIAILLTTHDLHEAATMADRVSVLINGRIVANIEHGLTAEGLQSVMVNAVKTWAH